MLQSHLLTTKGTWSMIKRGTLRCPQAVNQPSCCFDSIPGGILSTEQGYQVQGHRGTPHPLEMLGPSAGSTGSPHHGHRLVHSPSGPAVQLLRAPAPLPHPATAEPPSAHSAPAAQTSAAALCSAPALCHSRSFSGAWMLQSLGCALLCAVGLLLPACSMWDPSPNQPRSAPAEGIPPKPLSTHLHP